MPLRVPILALSGLWTLMRGMAESVAPGIWLDAQFRRANTELFRVNTGVPWFPCVSASVSALWMSLVRMDTSNKRLASLVKPPPPWSVARHRSLLVSVSYIWSCYDWVVFGQVIRRFAALWLRLHNAQRKNWLPNRVKCRKVQYRYAIG
jgi:hypothetical protein